LITGGAGFIGSNLACRLLDAGERVIVLDDLSRPNVEQNLVWLRERFGARAELVVGDVRDQRIVREAVGEVDHVFHFAAQVAVTTSLERPTHDFDVNAGGTLCVLEALRALERPPSLFFTSTNKVYGALPRLALTLSERGYQPSSSELQQRGVNEETPLDFHSPYGCSKGCADQYVLDYARSFGLRSVVFRMSCIYGPRQFGTEDQGWVAHFLLRALRGEPITIYGDGQQTRDLLFVTDLLDAFLAARGAIEQCSGEAFNIGGGPSNCVSVAEVLERARRITGCSPVLQQEGWRVGDQRYYVADTSKFSARVGWRPRVGVQEGLEALARWLESGALAALERGGGADGAARAARGFSADGARVAS
jgi:CDP-paratose 2-epimerase